jgi:hypothetical protein
MDLQTLELALKVVSKPQEHPIPPELEHLTQQEWLALTSLLLQLELEKREQPLQ